jgi:predicted transcriptional regulator
MRRSYQKTTVDNNFEPSLKMLSRIMKVILEKDSISKTSISQEANIQYARLLKHLDWLEEKHLVESILEDGKVGIKFTRLGREFASLIILKAKLTDLSVKLAKM